MKNIYITYADSILPSLKSNFKENGFYFMYEYTYEDIKKYLDNAEALVLGEVCEPNFKEYIKPSFIGKIKTIGSLDVTYNTTKDSFDINNFKITKGEDKIGTEKYINNISSLILSQEKNFNNNGYSSFNNKKRVFVEVIKSNNLNNDVLYKKEFNHEIVISFDDDGSIIKTKNYKRFFKMNFGIVYDTLECKFYKNGVNISLKNNADNIKKIKTILNLLIENIGNYVSKEEILKALGRDPDSKVEKKNLHYEKERIEDIFINRLGISKEDYKSKIILNENNNSGYKILGEKLDSID